MKRLPHWHVAADAMRDGMWKFALANPSSTVSDAVISAQASFLIGIGVLEDFSTRDYAYDRGGDAITDDEMQDFLYAIWVREDKAS